MSTEIFATTEPTEKPKQTINEIVDSDTTVKNRKRLFYAATAATILASGLTIYDAERYKKTIPKPIPVVGEMLALETRIDTTKQEIEYDLRHPDEMMNMLRTAYHSKNDKMSNFYNPSMPEPTHNTITQIIQQKRDLQKDLEVKLSTYKSNPTFTTAYETYKVERAPYDKKFERKVNVGMSTTMIGGAIMMITGSMITLAIGTTLRKNGYQITAMGRGAIVAEKVKQ
jgi:hypothetical protein